jgi:hypothetical protein
MVPQSPSCSPPLEAGSPPCAVLYVPPVPPPQIRPEPQCTASVPILSLAFDSLSHSPHLPHGELSRVANVTLKRNKHPHSMA